MILNTEKNGLNAIWKFHEAAILEAMIGHREWTSAGLMERLENEEVKISRATVINFANKLVELGLATREEATARGGYRSVWSLVETNWPDFENVIVDKFLYKLWEIFPNNDRIKGVIAE